MSMMSQLHAESAADRADLAESEVAWLTAELAEARAALARAYQVIGDQMTTNARLRRIIHERTPS